MTISKLIGPLKRGWHFTTRLKKIPVGSFISFKTFFIHRKSTQELNTYSNRCPHLGFRVRCEPNKNRILCPAHKAVFNLDGKALTGPPAKRGAKSKSLDVVLREDAVWVYDDDSKKP